MKVVAPTMLARAAAPRMIARGGGTIVKRRGFDLSALPRMSADDVVTASLRGLTLGEIVCAPGVEKRELLDAVFQADLAVFGAQSPELAGRYRQ